MSDVKAEARKKLVAQTSDQLFGKLQNGKLFGTSKSVAVEILSERKEKGKFDGDLTPYKNGNGNGEAKTAATKGTKVKKEKVAKVAKEKKPSASQKKNPDWKAKFKAGDKVKFMPFRGKKELEGVVISSYLVDRKGGKESKEAVRIRVDADVYEKNADAVKRA